MKKRREKGSFTIEAILALSVFMFAFVTIVSLATVAKVESTTQYAIDQAAKEISQDYYVADRIETDLGINKSPSAKETGTVTDIDQAVQSVYDFSNTTSKTASDVSSATSSDLSSMIDSFNTVKNDVDSVQGAAQQVYSSFGSVLKDPKGVVTTLATMVAKRASNELISKIIAQPLCKALVPQFITSGGDADGALKKMGVVNGLEGLDFRMSSFLADGRSINVVVVYQIKVNGFGVFDQTLVIKQTASTAAWVSGTSIKDAENSVSTWDKNDLDRGSDFTSQIKKENGKNAVKSGQGIDAYDQKTNTFTETHSVNVFSASYSTYSKKSSEDNSPDNYSLKKSAIKSKVKSYANGLLKDINSAGDTIKMDDGSVAKSGQNKKAVLTMIAPEEAKGNSENLATLNAIAQEVEKETGVKVNWTYRDKALGA